MGLATTPGFFQSRMEKIVTGYLWKIVLVYIDGIIVYRRSKRAIFAALARHCPCFALVLLSCLYRNATSRTTLPRSRLLYQLWRFFLVDVVNASMAGMRLYHPAFTSSERTMSCPFADIGYIQRPSVSD